MAMQHSISPLKGDCVGVSTMWIVSEDSDGGTVLTPRECKHRMKRADSCGLFDAYVLLECTNLHKVRPGCRNRLLVVETTENSTSICRIGICLSCEEEAAAVLLWKGRYNNLPLFLDAARDNDPFSRLGPSLCLVKLLLGDKTTHMTFANLVDAPDRVLGAKPGMVPEDAINEIDGGYQMSLEGPTVCLEGMLSKKIFNEAKALTGAMYKPPQWATPPVTQTFKRQGQIGNTILVRTNVDSLSSQDIPRSMLWPKLTAEKIGSAFWAARFEDSPLILSCLNSHRSLHGTIAPAQYDVILEGFALGTYMDFVVVDAREGGGIGNVQLAFMSSDVDIKQCVPAGGVGSLDSLPGAEWLDKDRETHLLLKGEKFADVHLAGTDCLYLSHVTEVPERELLCQFDEKFLDLMSRAFTERGSYGSRESTRNRGHNSYMGQTLSARPRNTPGKGPGRSHMSQYTRNNFGIPHIRPTLHRHINKHSSLASDAGDFLFPIHHAFFQRGLGVDSETTFHHGNCANEIFTFGEDEYIFFCNEDHCDKDIFSQDQQATLLRYLCSDNENTLSHGDTHYMEKWFATFGEFDVYTTCAYGSAGLLPSGVRVYSFFVYIGLRVSIWLGDGVMHSFFGRRVRHCTAVTVSVYENDVKLDVPGYRPVGWGAGRVSKTVKRKSARLAKGG